MNMTERTTKNPCFMLTGFEKEERLSCIEIIRKLNGVYIYNPADPQAFLPGCTHVIAKKPCKSLKFLSAVASGKWILSSEYLTHSYAEGRWLAENDYEWVSGQSSSGDSTGLFEAPRRWRTHLAKADSSPPFCGWRVALEVHRKDFSVYKRLVEIGGGKATQLDQSKTQSYTHVLVHPKLKNKVRHFHERGIPCLPLDYLARFLLENPPPSSSSCCIFSTTSASSQSRSDASGLSVDTQCFVKLTKCDELLSPTSFNILVGGSTSRDPEQDLNLSSSEEEEEVYSSEEGVETGASGTSSSPEEQEEDLITQHPDRKQIRQFLSSDSETSISASEDVDPSLIKNTPPQSPRMSDKDDKDASQSLAVDCGNVTTPSLFEKLSVGYRSSEVAGSNPAQVGDSLSCQRSLFDSSKAEGTGVHRDVIDVDAYDCEKTDEVVFVDDVATHDDRKRQFVCELVAPESVTAKRDDIKAFYERLSSIETNPAMGDDVIIDCDAIDDEDAPSRFGKQQMSMVERFAEADHSRSVLYICSKLLSSTSYPPPDLIFLIMKKYVLDSQNANETKAALAFLQATLLHHPPSAAHIRHDDIYQKAMGTSFSTESSLLSATKLNLHWSSFRWNRPQAESHEWTFFATTLQQAMSCSDTERKNAVGVLLAFLSRVLTQDGALLHRMIWSRSPNITQSSALRALFKRYRDVIDSLPAAENFFPADEDDIIEEDIADDEDSAPVNEEINDDITSEEVVTQVCMCLSRVVTSVCDQILREHPKSVDVIVQCLGEVFLDANKSTLEWLFRELHPTVAVGVAHFMLKKLCRPEWTRLYMKTEELTLHDIVNDFLFSVPKPPEHIAKEWTPSKQKPATSGSSSRLSDHNDSSDKENLQTEKSSSDSSPAAGNVTRSNVNKRNPKGETPLHRACIQNQPSRVRDLLAVIGVDPNARDHAGWSPLSEACNHGHLECARELLRLPLANRATGAKSEGDSNRLPALEIDLLACPEEGTTPLHDALSNAHIEVARLLIEKGGIELLYIVDKQGKTPLDVCMNENVRSLVLEIACHIAANSCGSQASPDSSSQVVVEEEKIFHPPSDEEYLKVLPPSSLLATDAWQQTCSAWLTLLHHLLISYATSTRLHDVINYVGQRAEGKALSHELTQSLHMPSFSRNGVASVCSDRAEGDIAYVLKWTEVEERFLQHARKITDNCQLTLDQYYWPFFSVQLKRIECIFDVGTKS